MQLEENASTARLFEIGVRRRTLRTVTDAMVALDLLELDEDGMYRSGPVAATCHPSPAHRAQAHRHKPPLNSIATRRSKTPWPDL
jgi:hypothetical protein